MPAVSAPSGDPSTPEDGSRTQLVSRTALRLFAGCTVVGTVLPLLPVADWWVRGFDFPRVQLACAGALLLVWYAVATSARRRFDRLMVVALCACVVYQSVRISPYTAFAPHEAPAEDRPGAAQLRVMVANVLMENDRFDDLLAIVQRVEPDMLLVTEPDERWVSALRPLRERMPHVVEHPLGNTYGMALYSRFELVAPEIRMLIEEGVPSIRTVVRLEAGLDVTFHGLHPRPPAPSENAESTERDAELLLVALELEERDRPAIVAGDMNDVAWSDTTARFQRISGLLDPRVGRGLFSTFHAKMPAMRWPLDHVFFSDEFRVVGIERLQAFGSDHYPIVVTLGYPSRDEASDVTPEEASDEDVDRARDTIDEAREQN